MNVLLLGAGGFLGLNILDALRAEGIDPICGRRARSNVIPLRSRKARLILADADQAGTLEAAMSGVDVVVHAAGYYPKLSLDYEACLRTGMTQMRAVLDAAAKASVRRLIYLSSTATVAPAVSASASDSASASVSAAASAARVHEYASTEAHCFDSAPGYGIYHDLKWHMESMALAERRFEVVTLCPSACVGPWDLRVGTSALLVGLARGLDPPHPDGIVNLVDARDVGVGVARAVCSSILPARRFLFGAHNHRLHALLEMLAERYGVPAPSKPLTADEAKSLATNEELASSSTKQRPAISREIVDLVVHGTRIDATLATRTLNLHWRSLEETLDAFDDWARRMRFIEPLTDEVMVRASQARVRSDIHA